MSRTGQKIANAAAAKKSESSCVITGNTAMVGIQFNKQHKGDLTDAIEAGRKRVKDADNRINRVVVTADPI